MNTKKITKKKKLSKISFHIKKIQISNQVQIEIWFTFQQHGQESYLVLHWLIVYWMYGF